MTGDGDRKLQRSADRRLAGVCGGLAEHFGVSPTLVRAGWAGLTVLSMLLPGILVYLILWASLPVAARD